MSARDEKLKGIDRVMGNNQHWKKKAYKLLPKALNGQTTVTGEDVRTLLVKRGLWQPTHHNAWGGLIHGLVGRCMDNTGHITSMSLPSSHARKNPTYTVRPLAQWELEE